MTALSKLKRLNYNRHLHSITKIIQSPLSVNLHPLQYWTCLNWGGYRVCKIQITTYLDHDIARKTSLMAAIDNIEFTLTLPSQNWYKLTYYTYSTDILIIIINNNINYNWNIGLRTVIIVLVMIRVEWETIVRLLRW